MTESNQHPQTVQVPDFSTLGNSPLQSRCAFQINGGPTFSWLPQSRSHNHTEAHCFVEIGAGGQDRNRPGVKIRFKSEQTGIGQVSWNVFSVADTGAGLRWRVEDIAFDKVQDRLDDEVIHNNYAVSELVGDNKSQLAKLICCTLKVVGNDTVFGIPVFKKLPSDPDFQLSFNLLATNREDYTIRIWFKAPNKFSSCWGQPLQHFCQQRVPPWILIRDRLGNFYADLPQKGAETRLMLSEYLHENISADLSSAAVKSVPHVAAVTESFSHLDVSAPVSHSHPTQKTKHTQKTKDSHSEEKETHCNRKNQD